jgi:diaminohydroxyphosphoribosylaminopyrimidine deaminase/5-amino-6-(5-phosphoribosylamino)uracil reductase
MNARAPQKFSFDDLRFMRMALQLGRRGLGRTWPNPAVGAVIVKDGVIVGRGWTQPGGRPHAEVEALRRAGEAAKGATIYVTLEPCSHHGKTPPCADALIAAKIARVVSAMEDPNPIVAGEGHKRLQAAGIAVEVGLCADEAAHDHAGHIRRVRDGRPHVILKLAHTKDGMIGQTVGVQGPQPVQITGAAAQARTHLLRAQCDAILIGIGTALADDPMLNCRLPGMAARSPVRIVLDSALRLPLTCRLVASAREVPLWIVCTKGADETKAQDLREAGAEVIALDSGSRDLRAVLAALCQRGITRLMVEGGAKIARAFVEADLIDEAWLFESPRTIGGQGIAALDGLPLTRLSASPFLPIRASEMLGEDHLLITRRAF